MITNWKFSSEGAVLWKIGEGICELGFIKRRPFLLKIEYFRFYDDFYLFVVLFFGGFRANLKKQKSFSICFDQSCSQRAEGTLNKISNNISKTYTGLISVLQGFQKCIAWNPSN